ncbi:MAG TPA: alpha/beta fold hydrolase [Treponemataceae bacterium]|nr:alpha/beta fold hydrolase [Treponemataceae bacterium]
MKREKRRSLIILTLLSVSAVIFSCSVISMAVIYRDPQYIEIDTGFIPDAHAVYSRGRGRVVAGLFCMRSDRLVVLFHGVNSTINDELVIGKWYVEHGYSVLIPEYPGFGISSRYSANEKDIYRDVIRLIGQIQRQYNFTEDKTILYGRSLGAAIAMEMATRKLGDKLVLVSPFSTMNDMFLYNGAPWILIPILNNQAYDNLAKAKKLSVPTLIIGCASDTVIPIEMSAKLNRVLRNSKMLIIGAGDHGTIYEHFTEETFSAILAL